MKNFAMPAAPSSRPKTLARVTARYADFRTLTVAPEEQALRLTFEPDGATLVLSRSIVDRSSMATIAEHLEMASIAALTALSTDSEFGISSGIAPGTFTLDLSAVLGRCHHFQVQQGSENCYLTGRLFNSIME
ncbi:hypothetical protein [Glutamicibacter soli]|uniref:hypothetical protein n=1 Tax=Glutamicibacter soli TaxID=453836 RepID=UPI003FD3C336